MNIIILGVQISEVVKFESVRVCCTLKDMSQLLLVWQTYISKLDVS